MPFAPTASSRTQRVVGAGVTGDAAAVLAKDQRQDALGADWLQDAYLQVADHAGYGDPLVDFELPGGPGSHVVEKLTGALDTELVEQRRLRRRVHKGQGGWFRDDSAHDSLLCAARDGCLYWVAIAAVHLDRGALAYVTRT
jgi:hypothetical protein